MITNPDIKALGFTQALFSVICADDPAFEALIDGIITDQSSELQDRVGATVYSAPANATYIKKAEKCLVAAELVQRRINIVLGNSQGAGQEISTANERNQRKDYLDEAERWIAKLASGVTVDSADFASGALVTSHFDS